VNSESRPRQPTMTPDDELVREPLYPRTRPPQSAGRIALLGALAALLVVTVMGTTALVARDLHLRSSQTTLTTPGAATVPSWTPTPTPNVIDPQGSGWTQAPGGNFADVQFAQSNSLRGYLCGMNGGTRLVGVTTNGGDTWQIGPSLAGYDYCSVQVSATNPLDVALRSSVAPCGDSCTGFDTHYSTDGGKTWKAAPFPPNTGPDASAVWAGQYLYIYDYGRQQGLLKVSANGGAFTSIDPNSLVPGASGVAIDEIVAGGATVYVSLAYTGCSAAQACTSVVASGDGGKTWTRISNIFNMHLVWAAGTTLYGAILGGQKPVIQTSTDNGTDWEPLALPSLPGGYRVNSGIPGTLLPAADGTVFALDPRNDSIDYLRAGAWTLLPFPPLEADSNLRTVTYGPDGHPQRVWVFNSSDLAASTSLYWHAVHIV
jgi:hypothetical protein